MSVHFWAHQSTRSQASTNEIAEQLSRINEQLSTKARMVKRIWFAVGVVALSIIILIVIWIMLGSTTGLNENTSIVEQHEIISP